MTNQEVYTKVRNHLLKQGRKSIGLFGGCVYRGDGGCKCAIGCLIPDTNYNHALEGNGVTRENVAKAAGLEYSNNPPFDSGWARGPQIDLASQLQRCHDSYPVEEWEDRLNRIARDNKLEIETS